MRIGTPAFVAALNGGALPGELQFATDEVSVVALGDEHGWVALFTLAEAVRPHARRLVSALTARGRTVVVLSGDREPRVLNLAKHVGATLARGDAKPHDKLEYVRALQATGAIVAMVGDGVNDAPVLAQAQVSVALGSGTDLARISADMVLMSPGIAPLADAVDVAAKTLRIIRQNIAWATLYNAVAVPLAVVGALTPLSAAVGMSLSSLAVVLNALRLARFDTSTPAAVVQDAAGRGSAYAHARI
jgi:P-type Cu2+ transporter